MPRAKKQGNKVVGNGTTWNGFAVCEFDADSRNAFREWIEGQASGEHWTWFVDYLDEFKFTFSWNDTQSTYLVSMTGTDKDQPMYFGWTLSGRGRDADRALQALQFKHEILLKRNWVYEKRGDKKDDDWVG